MTEVKTDLASMEEHDNALRKELDRRAYTFYERDDFKDGRDREHWFRAEQELIAQGFPLSIENDAITVRLAMEDFPASALIISVSPRSLLIFSLSNDVSHECEGMNREILHIIPLPVEVDAARVTCELEGDRELAIRLPLVANALTISRSACV